MHTQTSAHTQSDTIAEAHEKGWVTIKPGGATIGDVTIFIDNPAIARQFSRAFRELAMMLEEQAEDRAKAA